MKRPNSTIAQQVEKTLALLDETDRVTAGPWFHTRLRTKIDALTPQTSHKPLWAGFGRLRPALLLLVIVLNLATVFMALRQTGQTSVWNEDRQNELSALATEYQYYSDSGLLDTYSSTEE